MSEGIFEKYELVRRLNTGGMGEIFLARQKGVAGYERTVIIKMILAHLAGAPEFVNRFTDESRLAASLSHGNIVSIFESGCYDGRFFMVMEYVDGLDLKDLLKRTAGRRQQARWLPFYIHVLSETAKALSYAHEKKSEEGTPLRIVHRDISPSNILISREGLIKLTDFGVAKATMRTSVSLPGKLHGKVNYMAPEQVRGMECDHRSDIFSLGVVAYEMLAGKRPFEGDSDVAVLEKIRTMKYVPLHVACPDVPEKLAAVISRAMESDPDARWQSAEEFSAALVSFAHSAGISLLSRDIAAIPAEHFDAEQNLNGTGMSVDQALSEALDDAIEGMLRTPSAGSRTPAASTVSGLDDKQERTRTISETVASPGKPVVGRGRRGVRLATAAVLATVAVATTAIAVHEWLDGRTAAGPDVVHEDGLSAEVRHDDGTHIQAVGNAVDGTDKDAAADVGVPTDADGKTADGDPETADGDSGRSRSKPAVEVRAVMLRSEPTGAEVIEDGRPVGITPLKIEVRQGRTRHFEIRHEGYSSSRTAVDFKSAANVTVALDHPDGRVVFRFFPADSLVSIDGKQIRPEGNLVELDLPAGEHVLVLTSNKGDTRKTRSFNIEPGKTVALGTIELEQQRLP